METQLTGVNRTTYDAIFRHPMARDLEWLDVKSLLTALADVVHDHGETFKITRKGQTLSLRRPDRKRMDDIEELMKVRRFLEETATAETTPLPELHLLVVVDHRMARVYKTDLHGTVPQRIIPYDLNGTGRHLHRVEDDANGQRKPELKSFYTAIARILQGAKKILVFGSGTGASSSMDQLLAQLRDEHRDIAENIVGSVIIDQTHMTENQLLAKAREFYATNSP